MTVLANCVLEPSVAFLQTTRRGWYPPFQTHKNETDDLESWRIFRDGSFSYYLELIHLEVISKNFVQIRHLFTLLIQAFRENPGIPN